MKNDNNLWKKWVYWFVFAVAIIFIYKTLDNFSQISNWIKELFYITMPFVMGILIAYILYLPCRKMERIYSKIKILRKRARPLSIITVYIISVTILILAITFVVPVISKSLIDLKDNFQNYYNITMQSISKLPDDSILKSDIAMKIADEIKNVDLSRFINIETITQYAQGAINFATGIFNFFVAIVVSFYILLERKQIIDFCRKLVGAVCKKKVYNNISRYFNSTNDIFFKFLVSQLADAIVVGGLTSIALSIMGVKYSVLLGFMIGLFNMIPYFGAIIAVMIAIVITFLTGGLSQAVWMTIVVVILQQIDANIINPKIVGDSLKISPLLVILAVTLGGAYFGVLGMFLAVPIVAVVKIILVDFIEYKNVTKGEI